MILGTTCAALGLIEAAVFGLGFTPIEVVEFVATFDPTEAWSHLLLVGGRW